MYTFDQGEVAEVCAALVAAKECRASCSLLCHSHEAVWTIAYSALSSSCDYCTGLHQVMGYDLVIRDRRQDIFHCSNHGDAQLKTCGMACSSILASSPLTHLIDYTCVFHVLRACMTPSNSCAKAQVFAGALGALAAMTVLSAVMGWAAPSLVKTSPPEASDAALFCQDGFTQYL